MGHSWSLLLLAGLFEIAWALGLKLSAGFTKVLPSAFTVISLAVSMILLALAVKELPLGTAYAVWVGIGAAGTAILGILVFGEPTSFTRVFFLSLLIVSIIGLKLTA